MVSGPSRSVFNSACIRVIAAVLPAVLVLTGCRHAVRPARPTVSLYLSGDIDMSMLAQATALVDARRETNPCLWLVCGSVLPGGRFGSVHEGRAGVLLANAAGIDGVLFGPEWLATGPEGCRSLIDLARFPVLGVNAVDSIGEPIGHPMLVRRYETGRLALVGVWMDSSDSFSGVKWASFVDPDKPVRRTVRLLVDQSDVIGVAVRPKSRIPDWDVGLIAGGERDGVISVLPPDNPGRISRLDLFLDHERVVDYTEVVDDLSGIVPDPDVARLLDSLEAGTDSILARFVVDADVEVGPKILSRALVDGYVRRGVDGLLLDGPLVTGSVGPGRLNAGDVLGVLDYPGRLVMLDITGWVIKDLLADKSVDLEWRPGLKHRRMAMTRSYRIATTPGFIARHPSAGSGGFELDEEPFWMTAVDILAAGGRVR